MTEKNKKKTFCLYTKLVVHLSFNSEKRNVKHIEIIPETCLDIVLLKQNGIFCIANIAQHWNIDAKKISSAARGIN